MNRQEYIVSNNKILLGKPIFSFVSVACTSAIEVLKSLAASLCPQHFREMRSSTVT